MQSSITEEYLNDWNCLVDCFKVQLSSFLSYQNFMLLQTKVEVFPIYMAKGAETTPSSHVKFTEEVPKMSLLLQKTTKTSNFWGRSRRSKCDKIRELNSFHGMAENEDRGEMHQGSLNLEF